LGEFKIKNDRLCILHFQQSWFSLGAALEGAMLNYRSFKSVTLITLIDGLKVYPPKLHHIIDFGIINKSRPEEKVYDFLVRNLKNKKKVNFHYSRPFLSSNIYDIIPNNFNNISTDLDLKNFTFRKMAIGMAVYSHLVTISKSSAPNIKLYSKVIYFSIFTCFQIINYLDHNSTKFDEFWIWNGRTLHERVVVEWCKVHKKRIKFLEVEGTDLDKQERWTLLSDSPHSRLGFQKLILNHWYKHPSSDEKLSQWYRDRRNKVNNPFLEAQISGKRFQNLADSPKEVFVFFTSSDDEVTAISSEWESKWGNQLHAATEVARVFQTKFHEIPSLKLVIRVHPNIQNKSVSSQLAWLKFSTTAKREFPDVSVILPKDSIDSYSLLDDARGVLVYGTTLGLEAVFEGKYLASLAPLRYDELCKVKQLKDEQSVLNWVLGVLSNKAPVPKREGSLAWANWALTYGNNWQYVKKTRGKYLIELDGLVSLKPNYLIIILTRIYLIFSQQILLRKNELFINLLVNFRIKVEFIVKRISIKFMGRLAFFKFIRFR